MNSKELENKKRIAKVVIKLCSHFYGWEKLHVDWILQLCMEWLEKNLSITEYEDGLYKAMGGKFGAKQQIYWDHLKTMESRCKQRDPEVRTILSKWLADTAHQKAISSGAPPPPPPRPATNNNPTSLEEDVVVAAATAQTEETIQPISETTAQMEIIDASTVHHERLITRRMQREGMGGGEGTMVVEDGWKTDYVITVEYLTKRFPTLTIAAQRCLIEGVQQRLMNILTVCVRHASRQRPPPSHPKLRMAADVCAVMVRQDMEARRWLHTYMEWNEQSLKERMRRFDEEIRMARSVNSKKRTAEQAATLSDESWWEADVSVVVVVVYHDSLFVRNAERLMDGSVSKAWRRCS